MRRSSHSLSWTLSLASLSHTQSKIPAKHSIYNPSNVQFGILNKHSIQHPCKTNNSASLSLTQSSISDEPDHLGSLSTTESCIPVETSIQKPCQAFNQDPWTSTWFSFPGQHSVQLSCRTPNPAALSNTQASILVKHSSQHTLKPWPTVLA